MISTTVQWTEPMKVEFKQSIEYKKKSRNRGIVKRTGYT